MARKVALLPPLELGVALPASIIRSDDRTVVILATKNGHLGGTWWRTTHGSQVGYNPSDLHGISRVNPLITGVITHLRFVG